MEMWNRFKSIEFQKVKENSSQMLIFSLMFKHNMLLFHIPSMEKQHGLEQR